MVDGRPEAWIGGVSLTARVLGDGLQHLLERLQLHTSTPRFVIAQCVLAILEAARAQTNKQAQEAEKSASERRSRNPRASCALSAAAVRV